LHPAAAVATDSGGSNHRGQLTAAVRGLTSSINGLLDACSNAAPAQKECDGAIRTIQAAAAELQDAHEPVNSADFYQCLHTVMEASKVRVGTCC
jgi:talin